MHAVGIGRHLRDHAAILVVGLELQFSPARHDLGAQAQDTAELLGRGHGLLRGLAVDVEHPREGEDKAGTLLRRHVSFSQSADSKAATSWASRGAEPGEPRRAPGMQVGQRGPLVDGSLATEGLTNFFGSTTRSNSASVTKPSCNAASFSVRSLSMAWWAIFEALS